MSSSRGQPLSKPEKRRFLIRVLIALLFGMAVALLVNAALFWHSPIKDFARAMVSALVLPVLLIGPLSFFMLVKLRRVALLNTELQAFAEMDGLTQVLNRGAFTTSVSTKLQEMDGCVITRGAFMVIDADHFKKINDRWGHATGDRALILIAGQMKTVLHRDDAIGRLGGEEFGVFLNGSGQASSRALAERLRALVEAIDLRSDDGEAIGLSISIGSVHFSEIMPFATLYKLADAKLYQAKACGRNRVEFEELPVGLPASLAA